MDSIYKVICYTVSLHWSVFLYCSGYVENYHRKMKYSFSSVAKQGFNINLFFIRSRGLPHTNSLLSETIYFIVYGYDCIRHVRVIIYGVASQPITL